MGFTSNLTGFEEYLMEKAKEVTVNQVDKYESYSTLHKDGLD